MDYAPVLFASALCMTGLVGLAGCDATDPEPEPEPVEIETPPAPDASLGRTAFVASCAPCHASSDGFDLAFFGFSDADIVRRGVAHVDTATSRDIAAYIRSLDVPPSGRDFRPFQPGGHVLLRTEWVFWERLFGTNGWPSDLTPEALRSIDPKDVAVSLDLPVWSSEPDESDWMPERPLSDVVLQADGGAVPIALARYHASPTIDGLLEVIHSFRRVTTEATLSAAPVCEGEPGNHTRPEACFEARRWMASLAGMHFLRGEEEAPVPFEVARLWWETGEAAVSHYFLTEPTPMDSRDVARWLYLGFIFGPEAFPERDAYLGEFLQLSRLERLAVFATLRRMVGDGLAHQDDFPQPYWDAYLAVLRAPHVLLLDVAAFSHHFLLDRARAGVVPPNRALATQFVHLMWEILEISGVDISGAQADTLTGLRDELLVLLEADGS